MREAVERLGEVKIGVWRSVDLAPRGRSSFWRPRVVRRAETSCLMASG
jgi:hypothetical protein